MNVTRRTRAALAGPRRGLASVLAALFLVLAVAGAGALSGVHLTGHEHSGLQVHDDGGQLATQAINTLVPDGERPAAPVGYGPHDCSDRHVPVAQCGPALPVASPGPAATPEPAFRQPVTVPVHDSTLAAAGTAEATTPSPNALGISRT